MSSREKGKPARPTQLADRSSCDDPKSESAYRRPEKEAFGDTDDRKRARPTREVEDSFRVLVAEWKAAVAPLSSTSSRVRHPAYQRIIALGQPAVPLLLREMAERPNHWFVALKALTGANPVTPADRGHIGAMTEAWLRWGRDNGYL